MEVQTESSEMFLFWKRGSTLYGHSDLYGYSAFIYVAAGLPYFGTKARVQCWLSQSVL